MLRKTRIDEAIPFNHEGDLHSDNGSPLKGATMLNTLQKFGVAPFFSRPSVSNDNAYSESIFMTLKYMTAYSSKPFTSHDEARQWVMSFVTWYNHSHHLNGEDIAILEQRKRVYSEVMKRHPQRWSGKIRYWKHELIVKLNPAKESS